MIRKPEPVPAIRRLILSLVAAALAAMPNAPAQASETATHHFSIVRPAQPVIVGETVEFDVTARRADNKKAKNDHEILVQITTGLGARPETLSQDARIENGHGRVRLSFKDVGPTIVQVTDKANAELTNSVSVSVLPQPRRREVRP